MKRSTGRILTSHAGSLPRPDHLIEANRRRLRGEGLDEAEFQRQLRAAVAHVVRRQRDIGIDVPGDGEYGKAMGSRVHYGAWWSYSFQRLGGLELTGLGLYDFPARRSEPGRIVLTSFADRRDRVAFSDAYDDLQSGVTTGPRTRQWPVCTGPVTYVGHELVAADIANFRAALHEAGVDEGFMTAIAPGSASRVGNEYYASDDEFLFAWAKLEALTQGAERATKRLFG